MTVKVLFIWQRIQFNIAKLSTWTLNKVYHKNNVEDVGINSQDKIMGESNVRIKLKIILNL